MPDIYSLLSDDELVREYETRGLAVPEELFRKSNGSDRRSTLREGLRIDDATRHQSPQLKSRTDSNREIVTSQIITFIGLGNISGWVIGWGIVIFLMLCYLSILVTLIFIKILS